MKKFCLKTVWVLSLLAFSTLAGNAKGKCPQMAPRMTPQEYCNNYARLAVEQMQKNNVPASITLAQGMLESGFGSSYLAVVANNHFGIKAYNWKGPVERCDDDAPDEAFCSYQSVEESFEHHSRFLIVNTRYARLFKLNIHDYKGWAKGLKECGYATSPTYAESLIKMIEDYHLDIYDQYDHVGTGVTNPSGRHNLLKTNIDKGLVYIICNEDDDLKQISEEFGIKVAKLMRNNDLAKDHVLKKGDIIYLQNKHNKADLPNEYHTVKDNESLWSISQHYGVTVKSLARRNKLKSYKVEKGQVLKLR